MPGWMVYDPVLGKHVEWSAPTEDAVARRLAAEQAGRLRFCHDTRGWLVFDGALWRRDRVGTARRLAREAARALGTEPGGGRALSSGRPGFVAGALRFASDEPALAVTAEAFDGNPWLLGTPDGPIDLRTGASAPADPADGISRATAVAPALPGADAPAWTRFLDDTFGGDAALIAFVRRALGYALTGSCAERTVLLGCGSGAGKTLLLSSVLHVMGDYACPLAPAALTRPGGGAPRGTRLVALAEAEAAFCGFKLARVAGGDLLGDGAGAAPKLLAFARAAPRLSRADDALRRRLCVVPFRHRPARPDRTLADALRREAPAILRWMIDGCLAWQARSLDPPSAVTAATADCLDDEATLDAFLSQRCECAGAATATAADLWRAWRAFAAEAGEPAGSQRDLGLALAARGFIRDRGETARFYRGLRLREALTHDAADA